MGGKAATIIGWAFGLILVYLLVANWQGSASVIDSSTKGSVALVKALQGRGSSPSYRLRRTIPYSYGAFALVRR